MRREFKSEHLKYAELQGDTLVIGFNDGDAYHYEGVPKDLSYGLMGAQNPGQFFRSNIRGKHAGIKQ